MKDTTFTLLAIYQYQEWYGEDDHSTGRWKNKGSYEVEVMNLPNFFKIDQFKAEPIAPGSNEYWRGIDPDLYVVLLSPARFKEILKGYEPMWKADAIELSFHAQCTEYEATKALRYFLKVQ